MAEWKQRGHDGRLTAVYVVATLGLVWLGSNQIKTLLQLERRRARPYIAFWVRYESDVALYSARLKNVGIGPAYDISVTSNPPLVKSFNRKPCVFTAATTTFLPPSEELTDAIAGGVDFKSAGLPQRYEIVTKYSDAEGAMYSERHVIDLNATADRSFVRQEPLGKKLDALNDTLKGIRQQLARRDIESPSDPLEDPMSS